LHLPSSSLGIGTAYQQGIIAAWRSGGKHFQQLVERTVPAR
jgi:hypothetical protein